MRVDVITNEVARWLVHEARKAAKGLFEQSTASREAILEALQQLQTEVSHYIDFVSRNPEQLIPEHRK
jgi:hypothetical protein